MIFDCHTHLLRRTEDGGVDPDELSLMMRRMKFCGVDRAVLLGPMNASAMCPTEAQVRAVNDHTLAAVALHPDVFTGFCYINPTNSVGFSLAELDRCIAAGPMAGVKLWVAVRCHEACLDPIAAWATAHEVPVLQHTWYKTIHGSPTESTPADVAALARRHPRAKFIMAHLVAGGVRGVLDVAELPNVCVDTSGSQPFAGIVEFALKELGADRVLYGSDWPVRDFATQLGKVDVPMSPADREKVLAGNLLRLLRDAASPSTTNQHALTR